jgi:hypothetical protein
MDFVLLQSEKDEETGRLVELLKYIGGDGLMPVFNVKVDGLLVFHTVDLQSAQHEYSMECV